MQHKARKEHHRTRPFNMSLHIDKLESANTHAWQGMEAKEGNGCDGHDVKGNGFRKGNMVKDTQDFIWITPDFLENFKKKEPQSNNGGLSFNSVKYYHSNIFGERLPPMFAERLRDLEEKATRKAKVKAKKKYRMNIRPADVPINIRGYAGLNRLSGDLKVDNPIYNKPGAYGFRSMDTVGEERRELHPDDVIESVAKANSVHMDSGSVLPEIRAAPCPIHMKRDRGKGQELLYSSNSHAKSPRRLNPHLISLPQHDHSSQYHTPRKTNKFDINIRIPEQFPTKPPLPQKLSSKDFVMTWLIHGSAPTGSNHFPDIVQQRNTVPKSKTKLTPRRSELSE